MRRLLLVTAAVGIAALAAYRARAIDHWEEAMGIGRHRARANGSGDAERQGVRG
ncbi:MAG TPA: hypothetical protein VKB57_22380 [Acidimicrobiales bacterium]|nr:hypothetical protein [Acidimicrobiales bacterium]